MIIDHLLTPSSNNHFELMQWLGPLIFWHSRTINAFVNKFDWWKGHQIQMNCACKANTIFTNERRTIGQINRPNKQTNKRMSDRLRNERSERITNKKKINFVWNAIENNKLIYGILSFFCGNWFVYVYKCSWFISGMYYMLWIFKVHSPLENSHWI